MFIFLNNEDIIEMLSPVLNNEILLNAFSKDRRERFLNEDYSIKGRAKECLRVLENI